MRIIKRLGLVGLTCGALGLAAPAFAQARCEMSDLQAMTDAYLAAQTSGDSLKLPLADFTSYTEQGQDATMMSGMLSKPQKIDLHRTMFDLAACATYTEVVVAAPAHSYAIGTRLQFSGRENPIAPSRVNEIESVILDSTVQPFEGSKLLGAMIGEDWGEIPAAARDSRATLLAAVNAYLDAYGDKAVAPPVAADCTRLVVGQGGSMACTIEAPGTVKLTGRHFVVDEAHGAVAALLFYGDGKTPDVHSFRIEHGKVRIVHVLTARGAKG